MRKAWVSAILFFAGAAALFANPGIGVLSADQNAIAAVFQGYCDSQNGGDLDAFMALWDAHGIKMSHGSPVVLGAATIREKTKTSMLKFDKKFELHLDEITVSGDFAYVLGVYTARFVPKAGGNPSLTDGKFLTVLRRQDDGSWKMIWDLPTSNIAAK